jgi:hypothetical protein
MLGAASIPMSAFPIAGDITGLAADAAMYSAYPEERTMGNYAMSALGVLPLVPGAAALRAARGESKTTTNAINVQGIDIPIRKPSDNINNVMQANFNYPNIIGNQTLNINDIYGGVRADPNERRRVDDLSAKISGEGGFISRIIVDQDNNVVEGQHRLEALRQLGASEVPVYKIEDLSSTLPVLEMENAINNSGKIHPDNVNQIMQYALENIAEHGIDGARDFDFGNYQKYYDAALRAARGTTSPLEGTLDMSTDARMQRAAEQGFNVNTPVYHGTAVDFKEFDPDRSFGSQFWSTTDKAAIEAGEVGAAGRGVIKEMFQRIKNPAGWAEYDKYSTDELIAKGYDGLALPDADGQITYVAFEPSQYRDVNAAFNPAMRDSANLMAGAAGATFGLSALRNIQREDEQSRIE